MAPVTRAGYSFISSSLNLQETDEREPDKYGDEPYNTVHYIQYYSCLELMPHSISASRYENHIGSRIERQEVTADRDQDRGDQAYSIYIISQCLR